MSNPPARRASEGTPVGHVSVHLGDHPGQVPFALERPQKRFPAAIFVSLLVHTAVIAAAAGVYYSRAPATTRALERARPLDAVVWMVKMGEGGRNHGGGGDRTQSPPRRIELPDKDALTVPVDKPRDLPLQPPAVMPADVAPPIAELDLSALRTAAGVETIPGAIAGVATSASLGPGDGGGAGSGQGRGDGPGRGPGRGPGSGGNEGGGPKQLGTPGLQIPRVVREVRPIYTPEAMRARIQGTAVVECIVLSDGTVGEVQVVKSLDRTFGLDQEAVKAARKWLFHPGTVKGVPVAVLVSIELTFAIK